MYINTYKNRVIIGYFSNLYLTILSSLEVEYLQYQKTNREEKRDRGLTGQLGVENQKVPPSNLKTDDYWCGSA